MNRCIYLKKVEPEVKFTSGEHIIPAGIGGITKLDVGIVSDEFNNMFSNIELDFMRNSIICLPRQFVGPGKRGTLSVKNGSKSNIHVMAKNGDFNNANLGYIKLGKPYNIPQLKIFGDNQLQVSFDQSDGEPKLQLNSFLQSLETFNGEATVIIEEKLPANVILLGLMNDKWFLAKQNQSIEVPINNIIKNLMTNKSVSYSSPIYESAQMTSQQKIKFNINNYYRVCAKIVFNFLALSKGPDFVCDQKFDPIRDWIVNGGENKYVNQINRINGEKPFGYFPFPQQSHIIFIAKVNECLIGALGLYGWSFNMFIQLCENFKDNYVLDGYICDWINKKEYKLFEYINSLQTNTLNNP